MKLTPGVRVHATVGKSAGRLEQAVIAGSLINLQWAQVISLDKSKQTTRRQTRVLLTAPKKIVDQIVHQIYKDR